MKGERKLRLVSGGKAEAPPPDDLAFSEDEIAAAEALRQAIEQGRDPLALELRAAAHRTPGALEEADLDVLAALALGEEPAASPDELEAAALLRAHLTGNAPPGSDAALLQQLRHAARPGDLPAARNEALIEEALRAPLRLRPRQPHVRRFAPVTMAALAGVAALAAGTALFVGGSPSAPAPSAATAALAAPALARSRSADDLFDPATPFPRSGQESARIDRIASARAADLRQNRFASWGVR
jgi:hypothetical protein